MTIGVIFFAIMPVNINKLRSCKKYFYFQYRILSKKLVSDQ